NVSRLDGGENPAINCAAGREGRVGDTNLVQCILRHPRFALSEFLELELLSFIVVYDVDRILTTPNLEVRDGRHCDGSDANLWARRSRRPLERAVEVTTSSEPRA